MKIVDDKLKQPAVQQRLPLPVARTWLPYLDTLLGLSGVLGLLALWEASVALGWLDVRFFPPPTAIIVELVEMLRRGALQEHISASMGRILSGFVLGAASGILLGLLMGTMRPVRALLDPLISGLYVVPKIAILPLVMLLVGIGEQSKVLLVAIAVFFVLVINTAGAVRGIDAVLVEAGKNFGANRLQLFWHVMLPGAAPAIFTGLRLGAGTSLLVLVAAEFVSAKNGLGYLVWFSWSTLQTTQMYVGLISISILGVLFTSILRLLARLLMPWQTNERDGAPPV